MTNQEHKTETKIAGDDEWLRHLSQNELASLGVNYVAYVRPVTIEGVQAFGIFGADGQRLGVSERRDLAYDAIRDNDLEPLSVH
ncbi:MAG: DUF1150 family protein [Rhodospirillales bacterium]